MTEFDILAVALGFGLVATPQTWRFVTHAITLVHELGHALVGLLTGAQVASIKINPDSSGVTNSAHPLKTLLLTRTLTAFWGYPFPVTFAGILLLTSEKFEAQWAWWAVLALGVVCLVFIRNLFGLLVTTLWLGVSGVILWQNLDPQWMQSSLWLLIACLFFGGVRDLLNLTKLYVKRTDEGSDIQNLRQVTHIPAVVWLGLMWVVSVVGVPYLAWYLLLR